MDSVAEQESRFRREGGLLVLDSCLFYTAAFETCLLARFPERAMFSANRRSPFVLMMTSLSFPALCRGIIGFGEEASSHAAGASDCSRQVSGSA